MARKFFLAGTIAKTMSAYYHESLKDLINSLTDKLEVDRIEIDLRGLSGPSFEDINNREID